MSLDQTAEDNIADTVKPRLVAAKADCNRIAYIVDEDATLNFDDPRIEECIVQTNAKLLILDPLQAYLVQDTDVYSAGRMRQQLKKVADLAAKHSCAVVIVGHMNKTSGEKNLYRGLGSIDITAIARSVLMISRDKADPEYVYRASGRIVTASSKVMLFFDFTKADFWKLGDKSRGKKDVCYLCFFLSQSLPLSCIHRYLTCAWFTESNLLHVR